MNQNKYQNKYRISSARHPNWDYALPGAYFITICTAGRKHYFGKITDGKMVFTEIGNMANACWMEIPLHFPFVFLDEFVIMPNHVHGILIFNDSQSVETQNFASLRNPTITKNKWNPNKFGPQSKNLGSVVRGFKSAVKTYATKNQIEFSWQTRYHDRIIRNKQEFMRIRNYISNNPRNWNNDEHNRLI